MQKITIILGSINAFIVILLGAFGAHALKERLTGEMLAVFQTGVQYHFYHSIGLIIIGLVAFHLPPSALIKWSVWTMLAGIILFSGSLYLLAITGVRWLGMITPVGGTAFIISWILLAIAAFDIK